MAATGPIGSGRSRVTASGLLSASIVKRAALICCAAAALVGFYLVLIGGWPILLLGVLSLVAGWAYTGGPLPIAYTPLGELFVVAFFGLGAVCGTYWLCVSGLDLAAVEAGIAVGLLAGAVLLVNNYRDAHADARVGRKTLAIMAGPQITAWIYAALILFPSRCLPLIARALPRGQVWPALIALPLALLLIYRFVHEPRGVGIQSHSFANGASTISVRHADLCRADPMRRVSPSVPRVSVQWRSNHIGVMDVETGRTRRKHRPYRLAL